LAVRSTDGLDATLPAGPARQANRRTRDESNELRLGLLPEQRLANLLRQTGGDESDGLCTDGTS